MHRHPKALPPIYTAAFSKHALPVRSAGARYSSVFERSDRRRLSSSAALEVATLRALRTLLQLPLDDVRWRRLRNALKCCTPACVAESWIRWRPAWPILSKRCFLIRELCSDAEFRCRHSPQCWSSIPASSARWRAVRLISVGPNAKKQPDGSACERYATSVWPSCLNLTRFGTMAQARAARYH